MVLGKAGAAVVIEQKDMTNDRMIAEIKKLYESPEKAAEMSGKAAGLCVKDTNERILAVIDKLLEKKKNGNR